jgi:hypothetical protein
LLTQATAAGAPVRMLLTDDDVIEAVELAPRGNEEDAPPDHAGRSQAEGGGYEVGQIPAERELRGDRETWSTASLSA